MFRNRELGYFISFFLSIAAVLAVLGFGISHAAAMLFICAAAAFFWLIYLGMTKNGR